MFKVGDEVVRIGPEWRGIRPGDVGVVVAVHPGDVRVRYNSAMSGQPDGSFGQIPSFLTRRAKPLHMVERAGFDIESKLKLLKLEERDHLNDAMSYAAMVRRHREVEPQFFPPLDVDLNTGCPLPVAKPPLGPDIGMFIRDGMSPAKAHDAIADRAIHSRVDAALGKLTRQLPKVRATLPGPRSITVHRAPRQMGWLNVKLGIGSDQHVLWGVAPVLDAFGREG